MNSHKGESVKITGEIPVSLNLLAIVNGLSISYLKVKGFFYIAIGLTWLAFQSPSRIAGLAWIDFLAPNTVGMVWISAGLVSIFSGFYGSDRMKRVGFAALIAVPALFSIYFFISWLIYILPVIAAPGYERGLATTASYAAFSASAYLMAKIYTYSNSGHTTAGKEQP